MSTPKPTVNEVVLVKRLNESLEELHTTFSVMSDNVFNSMRSITKEILEDMPADKNAVSYLAEQLFSEKYKKRATEICKSVTKKDYLKAKFWHELRQNFDLGPYMSIGVRRGGSGGLCVVGMNPLNDIKLVEVDGTSIDSIEDMETMLKMLKKYMKRNGEEE
jgi:hypothetical protein